MIFSENRRPPPDQVRGRLFPDHALDVSPAPTNNACPEITPYRSADTAIRTNRCTADRATVPGGFQCGAERGPASARSDCLRLVPVHLGPPPDRAQRTPSIRP